MTLSILEAYIVEPNDIHIVGHRYLKCLQLALLVSVNTPYLFTSLAEYKIKHEPCLGVSNCLNIDPGLA
jgi:hypothetical protein